MSIVQKLPSTFQETLKKLGNILHIAFLLVNLSYELTILKSAEHESTLIISIGMMLLIISLSSVALLSSLTTWFPEKSNKYLYQKERVHYHFTIQRSLESILTILSTIFYSYVLVCRSVRGGCHASPSQFLYFADISCNPYHSVPLFPVDTAMILMIIPYTCALPSDTLSSFPKWLSFFSWIVVVVTLIISAALSSASLATVIIVVYIYGSIMYWHEQTKVSSPIIAGNPEEDIFSKHENELKEKDLQTKSLIGNVAHDLKTPLASFMQGIDFIHEGLSNFEKKLEHSIRKQPYCKDFLVETRSLIKGMKNTNSFMLMEINRFLDFTKASKGLTLQPNIDTIDLMETIALPLTCMKNIQDRITISLLPISPEIHNFILTDKHWLQENLLCLLSNAVKYSTEGLVTIKISLLHNSQQVAEQVKTLTTDSFSTNHPSTTIASTFRNQSDEFLLFEVEDTGIGMSDEAMEKLFNPFQQTQKLAGGTGLGLFSLAKRIEPLGGQYGVRRRNDGNEGSLFWFTIPYRPDRTILESAQFRNSRSNTVASRSQASSGQESTIQRISNVDEDDEANLFQHPIEKRNLSLTKNSRLNILLVEDSSTIAKMTTIMLKRLGHKVTVADNGHLGLQMMTAARESYLKALETNCLDETTKAFKSNLDHPVTEENNNAATTHLTGGPTTNTPNPRSRVSSPVNAFCYDVVLMDFQMPIMDGLEATRRYRKYEQTLLEKHPDLPRQLIIGLSATIDSEIINEGLKIGLDDYFIKPLSSENFLLKMKSLSLSLALNATHAITPTIVSPASPSKEIAGQ